MMRQEWFQWILTPLEEESEGSTWYIDGSLLDGEWVDYRAVGFAVVVVAPDGALIGYGQGCPPEWCRTAAAAEAAAAAQSFLIFLQASSSLLEQSHID